MPLPQNPTRKLPVGSLILGAGVVLLLGIVAWKLQSSRQPEEPSRELITLATEPVTEDVILRFLETYPTFRQAQKEALAGVQPVDPAQALQLERKAFQAARQALATEGWLPDSFIFVWQRIHYSLVVIDGKQLPEDVAAPLPATVEAVRKQRTKLIALEIRTP